MKLSTKQVLLFSGLLVPILFWISSIIAGEMHNNYNHARDTISQLGALGTPSENLMTIFTWVCTVLSLTFLVGLIMTCRQLNLSLIPLIGIIGFTVMFGWAATFHSGNPLHGKGAPTLLLLLLGPLLAAILWRGSQYKKLRLFSILSFIIMLLILLRVIAPATIQSNYTGLIQRFVHLGWSVWFLSLSLCFRTLLSRPGQTTN